MPLGLSSAYKSSNLPLLLLVISFRRLMWAGDKGAILNNRASQSKPRLALPPLFVHGEGHWQWWKTAQVGEAQALGSWETLTCTIPWHREIEVDQVPSPSQKSRDTEAEPGPSTLHTAMGLETMPFDPHMQAHSVEEVSPGLALGQDGLEVQPTLER